MIYQTSFDFDWIGAIDFPQTQRKVGRSFKKRSRSTAFYCNFAARFRLFNLLEFKLIIHRSIALNLVYQTILIAVRMDNLIGCKIISKYEDVQVADIHRSLF